VIVNTPTSHHAPEPAQYAASRASAEHQRLRAQAKVWEEATVRVLAASGLAPGMSCLDAGAGPGDAMRLMAAVVGTDGQVTGADIDPQAGAAALDASCPALCRFVQADLSTAVTVEGAPFDYVFARLLLINLPDPRAALARLWSWVRAGGVVCVMDYDLSIARVFPETSPANEAVEALREVARRTGRDDRIGSRLPHLFQDAGLGFPDGTDFAGRFASIVQVAPMLRALLASQQSAICKTGILDVTGLAALDTRLAAEAGAAGAYGLWPGMAAAWKRKLA
jgi:SAM-dependent methyltransferase